MQGHLVLGLGFGDEGKGTIVDWLARQANAPPLVVRWNGGPQAAHHVVDGGRVHCFAQLGSASFVPGARTHLAAGMAVDPYALLAEDEALARAGVPDALARLTIDPRARLKTPVASGGAVPAIAFTTPSTRRSSSGSERSPVLLKERSAMVTPTISRTSCR